MLRPVFFGAPKYLHTSLIAIITSIARVVAKTAPLSGLRALGSEAAGICRRGDFCGSAFIPDTACAGGKGACDRGSVERGAAASERAAGRGGGVICEGVVLMGWVSGVGKGCGGGEESKSVLENDIVELEDAHYTDSRTPFSNAQKTRITATKNLDLGVWTCSKQTDLLKLRNISFVNGSIPAKSGVEKFGQC
ncbi:unnamed protein product [Periconia digitata]|uniref:Uncharacterized protein n=1 Tax=Periconia digitata TaxID=1303443 RepID=A0A9W4XG17_9PLEO|nr:unnamed protein product [Periconia digitata]